MITWPLFDGFRTRGIAAQRESEAESLRLDKEKLLYDISLEVRRARDELQKAVETLTALAGIATKAELLVHMTERGFRLGIKTKLDVDDAQENLVRARVTLARARRDYLVARVTLQWVMGTLDPLSETTSLVMPNDAAASVLSPLP